ncbi:phosphate uptake regulator PhoU, partial [archaeon]|nr:phosphate uptake regulator PhoU [archaeon]
KRKIQKTGKATYIVSLPKPWIVKNGIHSGDSISISEEKDKSLKLSLSDIKEDFKEEIINNTDYKTKIEILRKFTTYYLNGANKITINFNNKITSEERNSIKSSIRKFIGLEIIEESPNKLVIQDFFSSDYLSIKKSIKRAFNISKLVIKESKKIINNPKLGVENINIWEEETDRLYFLVRRQLNFAIHNSIMLNKLKLTLSECQDYLILISKIEKITDAFQKICINVLKSKKINKKNSNTINNFFDEILNYYTDAMKSIFEKDTNIANNIINIISKKSPTLVDLDEIALITEHNVYFILFYTHRSFTLVNDIAEIGLDLE